MTSPVIARWESRGGAHWVELTADNCYWGTSGGGYLGRVTQAEAIAELQRRVDAGYFLPDAARLPMRRVI